MQEAVELAEAMYVKTTLLQRADALRQERFGHATSDLFDWQGGKGVLWAPLDDQPSMERRRLEVHARLIDHLDGLYIGSKDQRVNEPQLQYMSRYTPHLIGLRCKRDTGEATAMGVVAGMKEAVLQLGIGDGGRPLAGLEVLVVGGGKVGLPLCLELDKAGARLHLLEPSDAMKKGPEFHFAALVDARAAVDEKHRDLLLRLTDQGRVHTDESEALELSRIDIVSPNGGPLHWLGPGEDGEPRAAKLAGLAERAEGDHRLRLVLGAANDQVPMAPDKDEDAIALLDLLTRQGIWIVPDPLVSPGGVIAVSHERAPRWDPPTVNRDAEELVKVGVEVFLRKYRRSMPAMQADGRQIWETFRALVRDEWE